MRRFIDSETIRYIVIGVSTTLVNMAAFALGCLFLPYNAANLIAIVITKLYAYFTNKIFVFRTDFVSIKHTCLEFLKFLVTRGLTGLIDYFGLILSVDIWNYDKMVSKFALQVLITVLNYLFGKFVVYTKKRND